MSNQKRAAQEQLQAKIEEIQDILNSITEYSYTPGEEILAFLGPTKAGKSTLINCLMGNPLKCKKNPDTEETCIASDASERGPVIGVSGQSETFSPKGYAPLPGTNWDMWDFPGFGDNKGTEQEIANAAAYESVLRPQESVRFVMLVPIDLIKSDNPMPFFKLLSDISLICPNIAESFCIVASKIEKGNAAGFLKKALNASFSNAKKENAKIVSDAKRVIEIVLENNHCIDFKAPVMDGDDLEESFTPPNLQKIVDLIKSLKETKVSRFALVISDQAKLDILQIYTLYYEKLRKEISKICNNLGIFFKKKIDEIEGGDSVNPSAKLSLYKTGKHTVARIIKNSQNNFKGFFGQMQELGFPADYLLKDIESFVFVEKLKNMYKLEDGGDIQGEKEFLNDILVALGYVSQAYSGLIISSESATAEEKRHEAELKALEESATRRLMEENARLKEANQRNSGGGGCTIL